MALDEGVERQAVDKPAPAYSVGFQAPGGQFLVEAGPAETGIVGGGLRPQPAGLETLGDGRLGVGDSLCFFVMNHGGVIIPHRPVTQAGQRKPENHAKPDASGPSTRRNRRFLPSVTQTDSQNSPNHAAQVKNDQKSRRTPPVFHAFSRK